VGFYLDSPSIYQMMKSLNEILDKYNVSEKNGSSGNFKSLMKTIEELEKLDKVLLLPCSNRYNWDLNKMDIPKSTILALVINEYRIKSRG
jgi:hypothetical protein